MSTTNDINPKTTFRNTYVSIEGFSYGKVMEIAEKYAKLTDRPIEEYLKNNKDSNTIFEPFESVNWKYLICSSIIYVSLDKTDIHEEILEATLNIFIE